jgi:DNA-binding NarL/FixJ family response regulator
MCRRDEHGTLTIVSGRVLIVDDSPEFRRATRRLLTDAGWVVVGEAEGVTSGYAAALELRPDVVLADIAMTDGSGIDLAQRLSRLPGIRTVLVSSRDGAGLESAVVSSGAVGFLPKARMTTAALAELLEL